MPNRDFNEWVSGFRDSIADYGYYIDFEKVYRNVESVRRELHLLNSLIGSNNIETEFENLVREYPRVLNCIPILLAVRANEIYCRDENGGYLFQFDFEGYPLNAQIQYEKYKYFMRETGLFNLLGNRLISNIVDYVTGVETGIDSNGRKNRGGHLMKNLVESFIIQAGFIRDETYFKEMNIQQITDRWGLDLSNISNRGRTVKRFDFVIKTDDIVYAVETNFYSGGGSKLNETARSYKNIAIESEGIEGFVFVWITDGKGWISARNNLKETFDVMQHIYSIEDLENGIIGEL